MFAVALYSFCVVFVSILILVFSSLTLLVGH